MSSAATTATAAPVRDDGPRHGRGRVLALCAVLIGALAWLLVLQGQPAPVTRWDAALLVALLYLGGQLAAVEIEMRRESHTFAFTSVPLVIGLLLVPIPIVVAMRLAASLIALGRVNRQEPFKLLLNLTSHALEVAVAGLVVAAAGVPAELGPVAWVIIGTAVIIAHLTGAVVGTLAISLLQGEWESSLLTSLGVPVLVGVVDVSLALTIVSAAQHGDIDVWLSVPIVAFLVVLTRSYARVSARYRAMERLDRFARDLGSAVAVGGVEASLLPRIADVLHAECAWVWSPDEPEASKLVHRVSEGSTTSEPPTAFDRGVVPLAGADARLFGLRDPIGPTMAECHVSEAIVAVLDVGEGPRMLVGVSDRSGSTRSFDREDVLLFSTLCSHATVSLRTVALMDRLRAESVGNEFLATHDALTGLPNRTLFQRRLDAALGEGASVAVLLVDLDRFKEVNDTLGHASGDELLIEIGERLSPWLASDEMLARLGGDEFALLFSASDAVMAQARADDVLAQLRRPFGVGGIEVDVDASIGVAIATDPPIDGAALMRQADVAMYAAKAGENGVALYTTDLDHHSPHRLALAGRLRNAIGTDELVLHYQPQVDLTTGEVLGVEALVRWDQPGGGQIPPDEFIPIAERTDLIHPLTRHVLELAISQTAAWNREGRHLRVAVNVSARNLVEDDLVEAIGSMLAKHRLLPHHLEVELTESTVMTNPGRAAAVMTGLRELGVRIAIDDFGTGHSSLSYLSTLDVDTLKIDRSFIAALSTDPTAATIVHAVIDLARNLHLEVVAEGVETAATARTLTRMGCASAQGYLYSRPVPPKNLVGWLHNHAIDQLHTGVLTAAAIGDIVPGLDDPRQAVALRPAGHPAR